MGEGLGTGTVLLGGVQETIKIVVLLIRLARRHEPHSCRTEVQADPVQHFTYRRAAVHYIRVPERNLATGDTSTERALNS